MKLLSTLLFFILFFNNVIVAQQEILNDRKSYNVSCLKGTIVIDGQWDKPQWNNIKPIEIENFIRENPDFRPYVQAKMMYDDENLYVIFRVEDRFVRSITTEINGPVWKDSAVEFFFSPDTTSHYNYFNLEVNSGGTPLLGYQTGSTSKRAKEEDIKGIEIAHSLPQVVDPEITIPVTWIVEYRIPLGLLEKYSKVVKPRRGVIWRANFYKIAENNSNPHHATWSVIEHPKPTFHLPQYFGNIIFQ